MTAANVRAVLTGLKFLTFTGVAQAGPITITGAAAGDKVLYVCGITTAIVGNMSTKFESTITTINQIQQSAAENLTAKDYLAVLLAVA